MKKEKKYTRDKIEKYEKEGKRIKIKKIEEKEIKNVKDKYLIKIENKFKNNEEIIYLGRSITRD